MRNRFNKGARRTAFVTTGPCLGFARYHGQINGPMLLSFSRILELKHLGQHQEVSNNVETCKSSERDSLQISVKSLVGDCSQFCNHGSGKNHKGQQGKSSKPLRISHLRNSTTHSRTRFLPLLKSVETR